MASQVSSHAFSLGLNLMGISFLTGALSAFFLMNPSIPLWTLIIPGILGVFASCYSIMNQVEEYVSQQAI